MITLNLKSSLNRCLKFSTFNLFFLILFSFSGLAQQKAFPTVNGAGSHVTGGRGGIVVKVTNLNNSGPGSLRSALMMTQTRTIVFEVSGTIVLTSAIELIRENSNFTVAGQTAPEGGITISNHLIQMGGGYFRKSEPCNNAIWRFVRFRNGRYTGQADVREHNGFLSTGCEGLVFDHCSFSFCDDQAIAVGGNYGKFEDVTIQRCLFSENATQIIAGYNVTFDTGKMTVIENAFIDTSQRTPNIGGTEQYDVINNYYFNWRSRLVNLNNGSPEVNFIGNYMKEGLYTQPGSGNKYQAGSPSIYTASNYHSSLYQTPQLDDREIWLGFFTGQAVSNSRFTTTMHPLLNDVNIGLASDVPNILNDVGANRFLNADGSFGAYSDSFDQTKLYNAQNSISSDPQNKIWTMPTLPLNTRPASYDTDNDGMADLWEMNMFNTLSKNGTEDTDGDGYTDLEEFLNGTDTQVINNAIVSINANHTTVCQGKEIVLTASDAASYLWSNGETTQAITVTPQTTTTYTVTAQFTNGNTDQDEITITVNATPNVDAGSNVEICQGESVTLTASGGTSYLWNTGASTQSITVSPNGTTIYSVEVTQNGCSDSDDVMVIVNSAPNVYAGANQTINLGQSVTLTASGASSYIWSNGQTSPSITVSPNSTSTYSVTGSLNGCEATDDVTVYVQTDNNESVNADIGGGDFSICSGTTTVLVATGGSSYLWSTGETTSVIAISPTETTTYTVTAYSESGSSQDQDSITVSVYGNVDAGDDVEICLGSTVTLTSTVGESYLWNTGETTQSITVSPSETTTYTVQLTEKFCTSSDDVTVTISETLNVSAGNDITITEGQSTILTASGADSYLWSTGETSASITVNPNSTTTYSVTGYSGSCQATDELTVTVENETVNANAGPNVTICDGEQTTLTATGGLTYLWNTGATSASITVSPQETTTYSVTVYGASQSSSDQDAVTVTVNPLPSVNAGNNITITQGNSTSLTATGADSYLWSTGETSATININPESTTTYSVTGFLNGCEATDQITVFVETDNSNETVDADIAGGDFSICAGATTILVATGGSSYLWSTGETTQVISISPTETTTYTVTAYSESGNTQDQDSITISVYGDVDAGEDVAICLGNSTVLTATQGDSYLWSNGATSQSITVSPIETTTYTVEVFEKFCSGTDEVVVTVSETLNVNAGSDVSIDQGDSVTLTASGAQTYLWNTGATSTSITVNPNSTTTYSVTGYTNGCEGTDYVTVTVNEDQETETVDADIAGGNFSICAGTTTVLMATGGSSYLWSTGETTSVIMISPTETTTYTVTAYSESGNSQDQDSVTIAVNNVQVDAGNDVTILEDESTVLTATGANNYLWSTGETTQSISVSPSSTQMYTVIGYFKGCEDSSQVTVTVETTNIRDVENSLRFNVYQNSARQTLKVKIEEFNQGVPKGITVLNINGKVVYNASMESSETEKSIDVSRFYRGIYVIRLTYEGKSVIKKVVIK